MKYISQVLALLVTGLLLSNNLCTQNKNPEELLKISSEKCLQIKGMTCRLKMQERFGKKIIYSDAELKVSYNPSKIYFKQYKPRAGMEILYAEGERKNNMLIYTNGFPWVNVSYSPYANMVHKESHHNVTRSGLKFIGKIMANFLSKKTSDTQINLMTDEIIDGKSCFRVLLEEKDFGLASYTVKKGETIHSIADKHLIATHAILENNPSIFDDFDDVPKEGQKIMLPKAYGKKIILWIEKKSYLPLKLSIEDDKGIYEVYEYLQLKINPTFKVNEFNENFEEYNF